MIFERGERRKFQRERERKHVVHGEGKRGGGRRKGERDVGERGEEGREGHRGEGGGRKRGA